MITAIVQFALPAPLSREQARSLFLESAPRYSVVQGLVRKYYLLSPDGATSGGAYLFDSRENAERLFTDEWTQYIVRKYGGEPAISYFETPVIVDNAVGEVVEG